MKTSAALPVAVALVAGMVTGTPVAAEGSSNCYWDGNTLAGDLSNCIINIGPIGQVPVPSESGYPSSSPSPAPSSPVPVTPLEEVAKAKLHKVTVTSISKGLLRAWAFERLEIRNLTDDRFSVQCFWEFECTTDIPEGHKYAVIASSSKDFVGTSSDRAAWAAPNLLLGTRILRIERVSEQAVNFEVVHVPNPQNIVIRTDKETKSFSTTMPWSKFEHTAVLGEPITITPEWKTNVPLAWTNLPPGLAADKNGVISGKPSRRGVYEISAKDGLTINPVSFVIRLDVKSPTMPPSNLRFQPEGVSSARLTFTPGISEDDKNPDYYTFRLRPKDGGPDLSRAVDGDAKNFLLTRLTPGSEFEVQGRSCQAATGKCSEWGQTATLTVPPLRNIFSGGNQVREISQQWTTGSINSAVVTVNVTKSKRFTVRVRDSKTQISSADIKTFNSMFKGLTLQPNGTITGRLRNTPSPSSQPVAYGNLLISFLFIVN